MKKTHDIGIYLLGNPEIVAGIFALGVEHSKIDELADAINEAYPKSPHRITQHYIRKLYHRERPFNQPGMFRLVKDEHKDDIASRFRDQLGHPPVIVGNETPLRVPDRPADTVTVLSAVLEARLAYQKAIDAALAFGLDEKSVKAWCDVVAHGDLQS
jgi:hypothetical protein